MCTSSQPRRVSPSIISGSHLPGGLRARQCGALGPASVFAAAVGQRGEVAAGQGDGECHTMTTPSMLRPAAALQECRGWMAFWKR